MTDLDAAVADVKTRIATAQREQARAEAQRDAAQARVDALRQILVDEFGVTTVAEAQARIQELENELEQHLVQLTAALDQIEE